MSIKPNDEERGFGTDRERQREVSNESGRNAHSSNGENGSRGDASEAQAPSRAKSNRGFASMDRSKQKEIASKGGRAAHQKGTAHEFDSGEARSAGRKGGVTVSRNREHMAEIGRRGGEARGANRSARLQAQSQDSPERAAQNPVQNADRSQPQRDEFGPTSPSRQSGNSLGGESRNEASADRNIERP